MTLTMMSGTMVNAFLKETKDFQCGRGQLAKPKMELLEVLHLCAVDKEKKSKTQDVFHPRPTMQLGCEARVTASCDGDGIWKISVVQLLHNHDLSPIKSRIYRCNRSVPASVKKQLEVNDKAGIPLHKSFQVVVVEAGGYEELGFIEKDCRNYIEEFRRLRLGLGDAEAIQGYFNKMQAKNDGFFFSMDVDEESRLRNVFWVDNRCRQCYKSFGDVVTFDTTYLTNKYELRFAPFVGVNHHGQSVLLGCGLIAHEDTESFVWLFKTWLQSGGYEELGFIEKDCRNYIEEFRRLRLGLGDAEAIQGYFNKMQAKNDGFFFSMDVDEESRLRNVFWVDNRCRQCYKSFGDVVTFDTTYLTNKYELRFAPFVGVNHHGQSVLLGCGLIAQEDAESFVCLFKTRLQCMDGVPPQGIITDQDQAMAKAISIMFPGIKHRWSLWHILNKLPEKLGGRSDKVEIMDKINDLVYDVHLITEFEQGWREMIMDEDLNDNEWLAEMFFWRERWVPCYLRTSFWAGMSSTQRSESMNAFFDGYVHSKTTLKQFVDQYDRALRKKMEMEFQADASSFTKMIPCVTMYEMEKQLQDVYTISKFKEFQTEILGKVYCDIISNIGDTFVVEEYVCIKGFRTRKSYEVAFDPCTQEVDCTCHLFEFKGMICRHCIVVFIRNVVRFLPKKYILERWRRDVKRAYTRVKVDYDGSICTVEQQRYDDLCNSFRALANKVVDDKYRTKEIMDWIQKEMSVEAMRSQNPSKGVQEIPKHTTSTTLVLDPLIGTRKGAPRKSHLKSNREKCGQKKTRKRTTEKNPKPKEGRKNDSLPKKRKKMDEPETLGSQRQHAWPVQDEDGVYDLTLGGLDLGLSLH
ncbi:unnamed protein product [Cuscuta campestris]|uniref:SWIM-type domain-containing protein n=1 Tax=Cuscuta campestris TaxID=132261 RepID=A0A484NPQ1_9ASTE|nr:unnamed protein product [Cuscuta campestris]